MYLFTSAVVFLLVFPSNTCAAYHAMYPENKVFISIQNLENSDDFVVGLAQRNQFPYQISLQRGQENDFYHICSGAILSNKWVVSTAYCATPVEASFRVVAGILVKNEWHPDVQKANVEFVVIHPDYKRGLSTHDIALLKLKTSLVFSKFVQAITLPEESLQESWGAAMLSSWKVRTRQWKELPLDDLHYIVVFIMTESACENALLNTGLFSSTVLCSEKSTHETFCPGESGAPLLQNGYLIGLTSWGTTPCGITVYTKVVSFFDFIKLYIDL